MAKTTNLIRFGLSVSLVLAIVIPAIILTFDNQGVDDVRDLRFELTEVAGVGDHGMFRDQQKDTGQLQTQIQPQSTSRKTTTRLIIGADLGEPQILGNLTAKVVHRVDKALTYFREKVMVEARYEKVRTLCRNHNEHCALWSVKGQCHKNPIYMRNLCAPVCFSCEDLHAEAKCALDANVKNAWYSGDLNRMFERLTTDKSLKQYTPKVLSRPSFLGKDTNETADYKLGPWVILLEDFVSAEEAERMIQAGTEIGYKRSLISTEPGASEGRTSTNAWCQNTCEADPLVASVTNRIGMIAQIPHNNSEKLQLLRYEEGQYYKEHNDYTPFERECMQGVRILTVFLYLNDVEEGGGTNFPGLNLTVESKRGRALIWPSVLDENPHKIDHRTNHQALPVIKGLKYGANAWLHQRDLETSTALGCSHERINLAVRRSQMLHDMQRLDST
jgi:prolyl 4-hydroxylase